MGHARLSVCLSVRPSLLYVNITRKRKYVKTQKGVNVMHDKSILCVKFEILAQKLKGRG